MNASENTLENLHPSARHRLLGEAVFLLARNPIHRAYTVEDFAERILPPLKLDQFRLYHRANAPVALLTWAFVSNALHERMHHERIDLEPEDWNSGPHLWYTDFVAPFGDGPIVIEDMLTTVFPTLVGRAQRAKLNSRRDFVLQTFYGKQVDRKARSPKRKEEQTA